MDKKILGDYNLIKQIGQGPLGAVFLAEHRFIKRQFALKLLPEELSANRGFIQRFEKQVALLASLDHPHIVKTHNISYADGIYFLVTDCIVDQVGETSNLAQFLTHNERRLTEEEILSILHQIASALDYAHAKLLDGKPIAHRGIKLNNILMGKSLEGPLVTLSDFGLSHIVGEGTILTKMYKLLAQSLSVDIGGDGLMKSDKYPAETAPTPKLSKLHLSFLQNFSFLAPEQKEMGRLDQVDMKCDVWAFGVLAYFLIMRTFPEGYFPLPSEFMSDYKYDWDCLIRACLNPDPLKRPLSLTMELSRIQRSIKEEAPAIKPQTVRQSASATFTAPVQELPQALSEPVLTERPMPRDIPLSAPYHHAADTHAAALYESATEYPRFQTPDYSESATQERERYAASHTESMSCNAQQPAPSCREEPAMPHPSMLAGRVTAQTVRPPVQTQSSESYQSSAPVAVMDEVKEKPLAEQSSVVSSIPSFFKVTRPYPNHLDKGEPPKPILNPQEIKRPTYEPDPGKVFQVESTVALYKPEEREIKEIEPILSDMAVIPGGEYLRGSNEGVRDERPMHRVLLSSFALDIHPVTNEQFVRFLEAMGGEKDSNNNDIIRLRESRIKRLGGSLIIESGYAKHPVVGITWYGAVAYAKWVGKRLPTEAEWEIAAKCGAAEMTYPTGINIDRTQANFFSADTTAVLSYPPTSWGLYDVAGNVYEWCQDWYDYHYYESSLQEPENPKGPIQGVYRVLRGGCWKSLKDDLRCAHRHRNNPGTVNKTYGFRCAADVS